MGVRSHYFRPLSGNHLENVESPGYWVDSHRFPSPFGESFRKYTLAATMIPTVLPHFRPLSGNHLENRIFSEDYRETLLKNISVPFRGII